MGTLRIVWAAALAIGCGGDFSGSAGSGPDDPELLELEADAGAERRTVDVYIPPWIGLPGRLKVDAGGAAVAPDAGGVLQPTCAGNPGACLTPTQDSGSGGAPSEPSQPDAAGGAAAGGSAGGSPPELELPQQLADHQAYLKSAGYAPCPSLEGAVTDCCGMPGAVFACSSGNCTCGARSYGAISSLCQIAPATPLQWECPR